MAAKTAAAMPPGIHTHASWAKTDSAVAAISTTTSMAVTEMSRTQT
ncbi:hypothetical protein [Microbacterium elymi]